MSDEQTTAEAVASVNRWLDLEHHRMPSHPVATSVAIVLSALSTTQAELAEAREGANINAALYAGTMLELHALRVRVVEVGVLVRNNSSIDAELALSNLVKEVESGT